MSTGLAVWTPRRAASRRRRGATVPHVADEQRVHTRQKTAAAMRPDVTGGSTVLSLSVVAVALVESVAGHGAVVRPPPRNAVDKDLAPVRARGQCILSIRPRALICWLCALCVVCSGMAKCHAPRRGTARASRRKPAGALCQDLMARSQGRMGSRASGFRTGKI